MPPSTLTAETRYQLLLEVTQKISGTLDLDAVLQQIIDALRSAIRYDGAGIYVLSRSAATLGHGVSENVISGMATRGFPARPGHSDPMLRSAMGIVGHVIQTGEALIIPDVRLDPRYVEGRPGTLSEMTLPIFVAGEVVGAFNVESDRVGAFTRQDEEILRFFAAAAAQSIEKAVMHRQVLEKRRIEHQLKIAREVQDGLLPHTSPSVPGYDIAAVNVPTWEIGGDYYDYIPQPHEGLGLAIADVSGKGIPAALIMATFRAALRAECGRLADPAVNMKSVNAILKGSIDDSKFVTAIYGILDPPRGRFLFVNSGHNPPLLLRSGGTTESPTEGGPPLGVIEDTDAPMCSVTMERGDVLALYTDGVIETTNPGGEEFGEERLEGVLRGSSQSSATGMIDAVIRATRAFAAREGYSDDFTLVVVKRLKTGTDDDIVLAGKQLSRI